MKRLITYMKMADGRGLIQSISDPIDTDSISFVIDESMMDKTLFIDADIPRPVEIENKKAHLYYNFESNIIEVEYDDIEIDTLSPAEKLKYLLSENKRLSEENESLRSELDLTHEALFELDAKVNGGVS